MPRDRYFEGPDCCPEHAEAVFLLRCDSRRASEFVKCGSWGRRSGAWDSVGSSTSCLPCFSSRDVLERTDESSEACLREECFSDWAGCLSKSISFCRSVAVLKISSMSAIQLGTLSSSDVMQLNASSAILTEEPDDYRCVVKPRSMVIQPKE